MFSFFKKNLIIQKIKRGDFCSFKKSTYFYDLCLLHDGEKDKKFKSKFYFKSNFECKFKDLYFIKDFINFKKYNFIWLVDDDIQIQENNINKLFDICERYNFSLAQPSVNCDNAEFDFVKSKTNSLFRIVNFIDMRAPLFKSKFILENIELFKNGELGLDWILPKILNYKDVAIIDDVGVIYLKKIEKYIEGKIDLEKLGFMLSEKNLQPIFHQYYSHPKTFLSKKCNFHVLNNLPKLKRQTRKDNGCMPHNGFQLSNRMMKMP